MNTDDYRIGRDIYKALRKHITYGVCRKAAENAIRQLASEIKNNNCPSTDSVKIPPEYIGIFNAHLGMTVPPNFYVGINGLMKYLTGGYISN